VTDVMNLFSFCFSYLPGFRITKSKQHTCSKGNS